MDMALETAIGAQIKEKKLFLKLNLPENNLITILIMLDLKKTNEDA